jgi:restriction endonuclease S subunit
MKIYEFAYIHQGHQITDEEIYLIEDNTYTIYTAKNSIKGYWDKAMIKESELPCLSYPTKGNTGDIYLQSELFDANNTAALILKEEFKEKINLEWLLYKLRPLFLQFQTSKGGVSYLNKDIVENIEVLIPKITIQEKELFELKKIENLKIRIEKILNKIDNTIDKQIMIYYKEFQVSSKSVSELFDINSGNSGLTEEYLYKTSDENKLKNILLTGSTNESLSRLISDIKLPNNKTINIYKSEGIHIIRKGKAGTIRYLPKNSYALNDDAYFLTLKKDVKYKVDLEWLFYTQKELFMSYSTNSDNGTWSKTGFLNSALIDIPSLKEQKQIKKIFKTLFEKRTKFELILEEINKTFSKDLE